EPLGRRPSLFRQSHCRVKTNIKVGVTKLRAEISESLPRVPCFQGGRLDTDKGIRISLALLEELSQIVVATGQSQVRVKTSEIVVVQKVVPQRLHDRRRRVPGMEQSERGGPA